MVDLFNENSLYADIVKVWGEHGAHADVYRELCKKAGVEVELAQVESIEDKIRRIYREENGSKIQTIKRLRFEDEHYVSLSAAKQLVEKVVG